MQANRASSQCLRARLDCEKNVCRYWPTNELYLETNLQGMLSIIMLARPLRLRFGESLLEKRKDTHTLTDNNNNNNNSQGAAAAVVASLSSFFVGSSSEFLSLSKLY